MFLLLGCLTWSEGQIQRGELNCELLAACGELEATGYTNAEACAAAAAAQPYDEDDCPAYDPAAMRGCIDAWQAAVDAADCDADLGGVCQVCGG